MKDTKFGKIVRHAIVASLAAWPSAASPRTIAWYHFEDAADGTRASYADSLANAVDALIPGRVRWIKSNKAEISDEETESGLVCRPTFEVVLPSGFSWAAGEIIGTRRTGLKLNMYGSGTGSAMGFLQVADDADSPRFQLQTFTIEFFMRLDPNYAPTSELYLFTMRAGSGTAFRFIVNTAKKINYVFRKADGTLTSVALSEVTSLLDGKLHHVAFVKSPSEFKIYVDSAIKANNTSADVGKCTINYGEDGNTIEIGANSASTYGRFPCWIDELRISDTALSPSSFLSFGERLEDGTPLEADTLVYHDFNTNRVSLSGARVFNNLATAMNAPTLSLHTPSGGRAPTLVTDDLYASNLCFSARDKVLDAGCWDFQYGDTTGLSSILSIDDTKHSGGASHRIYDSDSTIEMLLRFTETPTRTEMLWHSQFGTSEHVTYATRIYASSSGDIVFSLVSQAQADACLSSGNPVRVERTVTGGAADGSWHHLALVNDRSHRKVRCYWDRKLVGNEWSGLLATNAYPAISSRSPIRVSGQGVLTSTASDDCVQFKGRIDMLRVTARALAPEEFVRAWKRRGTMIVFQ